MSIGSQVTSHQITVPLPAGSPLQGKKLKLGFDRNGKVISSTGVETLCERGREFVRLVQGNAGLYGFTGLRQKSGEIIVYTRSGIRGSNPDAFLQDALQRTND